jgi:hypothetical protein
MKIPEITQNRVFSKLKHVLTYNFEEKWSFVDFIFHKPLLHEHFVKNDCFHGKISRYKFKFAIKL